MYAAKQLVRLPPNEGGHHKTMSKFLTPEQINRKYKTTATRTRMAELTIERYHYAIDRCLSDETRKQRRLKIKELREYLTSINTYN